MLQKLLTLIEESNLSIKSIAKLSGVSNRTIESWVYSKVKPQIDKAEKVLSALGYEIEIIQRG